MPSDRIIIRTGGQSGVDRASLDVALELGIKYEGWCPEGGWAEDMKDPPGLLAENLPYENLQPTTPGNQLVQDAIRRHPKLQGLPYSDPAIRTVMNVEASKALLTLTRQEILDKNKSLGSNLAVDTARGMGMPEITVLLDDPVKAAAELRRFLSSLPPGTVLDFNGPRASEGEGIYQQVFELLSAALKELQELPYTYLDNLDLDLVTHFGGEDEPPYLTGVYFPEEFDRERCFEKKGSDNLADAKSTYQAMLTAWSEAEPGFCTHCESFGWIVDEKHYCKDLECQAKVCSECEADHPCEAHRETEQ